MKKKITLFKKFKFFSLSVLFSDLIQYLQNLLSIKKIKFNGKEIKFYVSSEISLVRAELFGKKEKEVYEFIEMYLNTDDIFFDIGANLVFLVFIVAYLKMLSVLHLNAFSNLYLLKKYNSNNLMTKIDVTSFRK